MKLKTLHIASFIGNIGDNANHNGFFNEFIENTGLELDVKEIEIRDFYFNSRKLYFDISFIEKINSFDFVIIGGGNYFEIAFEESHTGCTIDLAPDLIDKIKTPILFNGVGFDSSRGSSKNTKLKFENFLNTINKNERIYTTMRNDGSFEDLKMTYGDKFAKTKIVPDGGFFINKLEKRNHNFFLDVDEYIAINLSGDVYDKRFEDTELIAMNDNSIKNLVIFLDEFIRTTDKYVVLTAHISLDYFSINAIISNLSQDLVRKRVIVAPFMESKYYINTIDIYRKARLVLSNRFHACVCSIALNTPVIGLSNYPKVKIPKLFNELGIANSTIDFFDEDMKNILIKKVDFALSNSDQIKNSYSQIINDLRHRSKIAHKEILNWLIKFI